MEGATAKLRCELSKAAPVEWRKGPETLRAGDRLRLNQEGAVCELEIRELTAEDAGEYSCVCGQERTSATLAVRGKDRAWPRGWRLAAALRPSALSSLSALLVHEPAPFPPIIIFFGSVMSRVCSVVHVQVGPFKVTVVVCAGSPAGGPSRAGCCVFGVLPMSCCFCVYRKCDSLCLYDYLQPCLQSLQKVWERKRPRKGPQLYCTVS